MSEWAGMPIGDDKVQRILSAVRWLESYRRLVLGRETSEAVDMLDRQVAYSALKNQVLQRCRFDYTVDMPDDAGGLAHDLYVPRVTYRDGTARETHLLTGGGKVLYYAYAHGVPLPPDERDPDSMAQRLEWLGDAAWFYPGSVTVDSTAREQGREA